MRCYGCRGQVRTEYKQIIDLLDEINRQPGIAKTRAIHSAGLNAGKGVPIVKRLIHRGYIKVYKSKSGKQMRLSLTDKARDWLRRARAITKEVLEI